MTHDPFIDPDEMHAILYPRLAQAGASAHCAGQPDNEAKHPAWRSGWWERERVVRGRGEAA